MATKNRRLLWIILIIILPVGLTLAVLAIRSNQTPRNMGPQFTKEGTLSIYPTPDTANSEAKVTIDIEIADNNLDIRQGLMYRKSMEMDQGMLFLLPRQEPQSFWMLNTYIALDVIFADADKQIVHIEANTQAHSTDPIPSQKPAKYVLEVNAGFCTQYNIKVGDYLVWKEIGERRKEI